MSRASPFVIALSAEEPAELEARVRRHCGEQRAALPARIVLLAVEGTPNAVIAHTLGIVSNTVLKWRKRFCRAEPEGAAVPA